MTTITTQPQTDPFPFPREYFFPAFYTRQTNLNTLHAQLVKWSSLVLSYCRHYRIFKLALSPSSSSSSSSSSSPPASSIPTQPPTITNGIANTDTLFHNPRLNRRLALSDIREVIAFMRKDGRAEYVYDAGATTSKTDLSSLVAAFPGAATGSEANGTSGTAGAAAGAASAAAAASGGAGGGGGGDVVWIYWRTPEEWAALVEAWVDETAQRGTVLTLYELTEGDATRGTEFHGLDKDLLLKALNTVVKRGKAQIFGQEDSQGIKFF